MRHYFPMMVELDFTGNLASLSAENQKFSLFGQRENKGGGHNKTQNRILMCIVGFVPVHFVPSNQLV
jgi:hypothetical protein